jgi:hypothetical protein
VRLSIGIEDVEDLKEALDVALRAADSACHETPDTPDEEAEKR